MKVKAPALLGDAVKLIRHQFTTDTLREL